MKTQDELIIDGPCPDCGSNVKYIDSVISTNGTGLITWQCINNDCMSEVKTDETGVSSKNAN
jgi:hypothetical protein